MRKAHFMDEHPIRTSASMIKAHFMDKHPIRASVPLFASGLEALGLLGDQFVEDSLVEIVDPHSALHCGEGVGGFCSRYLAALAKDLVDVRNILFKFVTALPDRGEDVIEHLEQELLDHHVSESAGLVLLLQLVERIEFEADFLADEAFAEFREMLIAAEGIEIGEYGVALDVARVADLKVERVGVHALDLCPELVGGIRKVDAVAQGLAHLGLSVGSRQTEAGGIGREHDLRLDQGLSVGGVEFAHDFAGLLDHRCLILADRHCGSLEGGDIGGLADRIAEEAYRGAGLVVTLVRIGETPHLDLGLDGRIALEPLDGHQIVVEEGELGEFADLGLDEDGGLGRVESAREIVQCHLDDVLPDLFRIVGIVSEGLRVSNHNEYLVEQSAFLKLDSPSEGAHKMADMEPSRRTVACKYDLLAHIRK